MSESLSRRFLQLVEKQEREKRHLEEAENTKKEQEKTDEQRKIHDLKREIADNIVNDFKQAIESCDMTPPANASGIAFVYSWGYDHNFMYHRIKRHVPLADADFMKQYAYSISNLVRIRMPDIRNHISGEPMWKVLLGRQHTDDTAILIAADFTTYKRRVNVRSMP